MNLENKTKQNRAMEQVEKDEYPVLTERNRSKEQQRQQR